MTGRPLVGTPGADVLAVPFASGADGLVAGPGAVEAGKALGVDLLAYATKEKAKGEAGEILAVPVT